MVNKIEDERPLLGGTVSLTRTAHVLETADKEFCLDPMVSLFHGKDVWPAVLVFKLHTSQEVFRDLNPEDVLQTGLKTVFL